MIQRLVKKGLLVAKSSVKAWAIDSHCICEIGKRCAKVTLPPKDLHCALQWFLDVKGVGASEYRVADPQLRPLGQQVVYHDVFGRPAS